jgi:hypothetical protein
MVTKAPSGLFFSARLILGIEGWKGMGIGLCFLTPRLSQMHQVHYADPFIGTVQSTCRVCYCCSGSEKRGEEMAFVVKANSQGC